MELEKFSNASHYTYVREVVVVHGGTALGHQVGELVGRADEEVVADGLRHLILVLVAIGRTVPVCVLCG